MSYIVILMSFTAIFPSIGYDYSNPQTILESLKKSLFGGSTIQPSYIQPAPDNSNTYKKGKMNDNN
jgi:hypothetical protein